MFATNNRNGFLCGRVLKERGYEPDELILHAKGKGRFQREIAGLFPDASVIFWDEEGRQALAERFYPEGAILLSVNFAYIFSSNELDLFAHAYNLHTGFLPWNRGVNTNVWSIVEETPAGVSLHVMTKELDRGDVLAQCEVEVLPWDTGKTLYARLEEASAQLLAENIDKLMASCACSAGIAPDQEGSYHRYADFERLRKLQLDEVCTMGDCLNCLRALTFPPYEGAYFVDSSGRKVFVEVSLKPEGENKMS